MKITAEDKTTFDRVTAHYGLDPDEIDLCKQAYCKDHEAGRMTYAALARELPQAEPPRPWVTPVLEPKQVKRA